MLSVCNELPKIPQTSRTVESNLNIFLSLGRLLVVYLSVEHLLLNCTEDSDGLQLLLVVGNDKK